MPRASRKRIAVLVEQDFQDRELAEPLAKMKLVQDATKTGKLIASICHGAQLLITAGLLKGRKATCWIGIRDDVRNAGADHSDRPVVVDGQLITSRMPADIPQFNEAILKALSS